MGWNLGHVSNDQRYAFSLRLFLTALIATGSTVIYPAGIPWPQLTGAEFTVKAFFQGALVTTALALYGRAVVILGASGGAVFGISVPGLSALFAVPVFVEWPTASS